MNHPIQYIQILDFHTGLGTNPGSKLSVKIQTPCVFVWWHQWLNDTFLLMVNSLSTCCYPQITTCSWSWKLALIPPAELHQGQSAEKPHVCNEKWVKVDKQLLIDTQKPCTQYFEFNMANQYGKYIYVPRYICVCITLNSIKFTSTISKVRYFSTTSLTPTWLFPTITSLKNMTLENIHFQ